MVFGQTNPWWKYSKNYSGTILAEMRLEGTNVTMVRILKGNERKEACTGCFPGKRGSLEWYVRGRLHRNDDLPAVIRSDGKQSWYRHGQRHRDNGLPAVINLVHGVQKWYVAGNLHRDEDLPAVMRPRVLRWFKHGNPYREGGWLYHF